MGVNKTKEFWWETEEGKEWLSSQPDIEQQFLGAQTPKITYEIGQRFLSQPFLTLGMKTVEYLLATTGNRYVCLINVSNGGFWNNPVQVDDVEDITEDEFAAITDGAEFVLKQ